MIHKLSIDGGRLVALRVTGKLTREDYQNDILPRLERALVVYDRLRCLCVLDEQYEGITPGAAWEEVRFDAEHRKDFERIAIVSDDEMVRAAVRLGRPLFAGDVRLFANGDRQVAETWIRDGLG